MNSILEMASGAIMERVDYEMSRVIANIQDVNTSAKAKRTITVTLTITPDSKRQNLHMAAVSKSKLEATSPVETALWLTEDEDGETVAVEMTPQIPGQTSMDGEDAPAEKVFKVVR